MCKTCITMYNLRTSLHHAQTACDIFDTQNKLQFLDGYQRTRGAYGSVCHVSVGAEKL